MMVVEADDIDAARKLVESDIYYKSNVVSTGYPVRYDVAQTLEVGQGEARDLTMAACSPITVSRLTEGMLHWHRDAAMS